MAVVFENSPAIPNFGADAQVVETDTVACDGGNGLGLGHPRVFLAFGGAREIVCPYCSRVYRLAEGAGGGGHGR